MNITFQKNGNLDIGVKILTIHEFEAFYGYNNWRVRLIANLKLGIAHLKECSCERILIDGSFVSKKEFPGDFDACWDTHNVDIHKILNLYPVLLDFSNERKNQKKVYLGEFFPAEIAAKKNPLTAYFHFFQLDENDQPKGIIQINLI